MPDLLASLPAHPARPTCADRSETFDADIAIARKLIRARQAIADLLADSALLAMLAVDQHTATWCVWRAAELETENALIEFGPDEIAIAEEAEARPCAGAGSDQ